VGEAVTGFVGRRHELAMLAGLLGEVREQVGTARPGKCVIVRGRRRIGKSALVEEFIEQEQVPSVFYTAEIGFGGQPLREFTEAVRVSGLPDASIFGEAAPGNWAAALRQLAGVLPEDGPSVVVLDELPYLMDPDGAFESVLQRAWDRELSRKPVLLILVGSDLSMMAALSSYGRPFHQRGTELQVGPLNPADIATMAGLSAAQAFDAELVTGGLPIICARWQYGEDTRSFLARELANPVSPLVVSAPLSLAAEFPDHAQARMVLAAIGSGERTFVNIARAAGGISHSTLTRATDLLIRKGVVAGEQPDHRFLSPVLARVPRSAPGRGGSDALGPDAGPNRAALDGLARPRGRAAGPRRARAPAARPGGACRTSDRRLLDPQ
jgi:hypothetical protein